jgi:hypothetical protein
MNQEKPLPQEVDQQCAKERLRTADGKFDRKAYQRKFMREWRLKKKLEKERG